MDTSIDIDWTKLDLLEKKIVEMAVRAADKQNALHVEYKADNSPVTEVDLSISHEIVSLIRKLYPGCGIITEEEDVEKISSPPFTFVLDPIDGTDMYSQGLPSFCIALGILDAAFTPVGAVIAAPRFGRGTRDGLLVRLTPGGKPTVNGKRLVVPERDGFIHQITLSSSLVRDIDFSRYRGKVRIFGSQILQILAPALFMNISASIDEPCFIWDYAAAHAILISLGMDLYTPEGLPFRYSDSFLSRKRAQCITYGGYYETVKELITLCPPLDPDKAVIHY